MNNLMYKILNNVNEGIVIINNKLEICYWNSLMENITGINYEATRGKCIGEVLSSFKRSYFVKSINNVLNNGYKMFFSAAMHKELINNKEHLNLQISAFDNEGERFLLLEFIDVSNQFIQIDRLKTTVNELYKANRELKEKEREIYTLAYYDNLTGVANRALFYEFADKFIDTAKRNKSKVGLMFLDVDKFKSINDIYGHETGDLVLKQIAKILSQAIRKNDVLARYGGDEFLILLPDIKDVNNHECIISRIKDNENRFVHLEDSILELSLSIGTSFYPDDGETIDKLIAKADRGMYINKKKE